MICMTRKCRTCVNLFKREAGGFITVTFIGEQRAGTWAGQEQEEIRYQGGVLRKFVPFVFLFFTTQQNPFQKLSAAADDNWEQKRVPRPKGVPEWGVPPTN